MDGDATWAFVERFTEMAAGATTIGLLAVADRSGLLRSMADAGAVTSADAAQSAGLEERYVTEILSGLAAAGVVTYDAGEATFTLPDEHAVCLADDTSPFSMTGWLDLLPETLAHVPTIATATRDGGGIRFDEYDEIIVRGIDRASSPGMNALLTRRWLATMPDVVARLVAGGSVADVGCGSGAAVAAMARAYPAATVYGFDLNEASIERARTRTAQFDNAIVSVCAADELPIDVGFDLVTTFDVVHDLADPLGCVSRIREGLAGEGTYLMMEPRASSDLEDNLSPRGALLYGVSTLHCMSQSLAMDGVGLGTAWGSRRAEELCREAGFTSFAELPIESPFSAFYRVGI